MAEKNTNANTNSGSVKINEVTRVTPYCESVSATSTAFTLPLTYFDTNWFKFPPVESLFFYRVNDLNPNVFNSVVLPKLKHSLSLTLLHYHPIAGHIMWPEDAAKPAVYYFSNSKEKDGVSLTVAESYADFNHLSGNGIREAVEFHPLVPQLSISDDKAEVIAIQITLFPKNGFSIGISTHHAVIDGKSAIMFIKSWAYMCKHLQLQLDQEQEQNNTPLLPDQLTPCLDRTVIKDPNGLDMLYVKNWISFTGFNTKSLMVLPVNQPNSNLVRVTFELSREDIKKLRDKVLSNVKENLQEGISKQLHLSSYVLTCAHVFVCLVKAKNVEANTTVKFVVAGDCRSRLDPPVPANYFGNCVGGEFVSVKARDLIMDENGIAFVADKLSDYIKSLNGDVIQGSEDKIERMFATMKERGQLIISVAGSNRLDFYGSDFGWGRPQKIEIVSIDGTGAISLTESRNGSNGFEIGVVLEKQQMKIFASVFYNGLKHL